jgi:[CysO sulfur-carrier protein]-thiocarboxylate-dependent cysteine synthase
MIERAEQDGLIAPGQTILEPTSGNTGISLAMICRRKGYPLTCVMPDNVTRERTELLRMYGAEIVYSEGAKGSNGAVDLALEMAGADATYYMPYQYGNQANPDAHETSTGTEILAQVPDVDVFVVPAGENAAEARRYADELRIVPVRTFQQALQRLATLPDRD